MKDLRFQRAEVEYTRLKQALAAGSITAKQCEQAIEGLTIEHQGRYWMLGANSAKWYVWDGQQWLEAAAPEVVVTPIMPVVPTPPVTTGPTIVPPAKTPAHKWVLGCLMGCASPLAFLAGVGIIVRTVMDGGYHSDLGMTFVAAGVFLFAVCLVALLPKIPLFVFLIVYALWTIAGFTAMQLNLGRDFEYMYLPDNVFATGIVALIGTLFGAAVRVMVRPKAT